MAKQTINLGTTPNDGTGTPLRDAFDMVNDNFNEVYGADFVTNTILANMTRGTVKVGGTSDAPTDLDAKGDGKIIVGDGTDVASVSISGDIALTNTGATTIQTNAVETAMIADDNVTPAKINILDDSLAATDAHIMVGDGTDFSNVAVSGDVSIANTGAVSLATNVVDFDELANRYSELSALGTGTAFALNFNTATTFTATANGTATFTFSNAVQGQCIDLILNGDQTINFSESGSTFNKVGSTNYAGASTNLIQIVCTDDTGGSKIYHYTVNTVASDTTP